MSDVLIAVKGGGGVSSDELTATANDLLKGKTAVTSDSNDDTGADRNCFRFPGTCW